MFIALGARGHGSATASALLEAGQPVTAVLHDPAKADPTKSSLAGTLTAALR
jgi:hypothetical protein